MHSFELVNLAWFLGWLIAVGALFLLALRLPLQIPLRRSGSRIYSALTIAVMAAVSVLAFSAVSLHDVHFDLTREKIYTPSELALEVADRVDREIMLIYFYQGQDENGRRARDMVEMMGRRNPLLRVQTVDRDKQPTLAKIHGVKGSNAALLESEGRRVVVQSTDENEIAIGMQRVLREHLITICFIGGHSEYPIDNFEFHTHVEQLSGHNHDQSDSAVIQTAAHGVGRLRRALEAIGYDVRGITPASEGAIPRSCAVTVDAGPRTTYLPAESAALEGYLRDGGALLLMYDLGFVLEPGLRRFVQTLGVRLPQAVLLDPTSHYGTDPEMVAVTGYDPHPVTNDVSLTFYPGVRPISMVEPAEGIRAKALIASSNESYANPVAPMRQRQTVAEPIGDLPGFLDTPQSHIIAAAIEGQLPGGGKPFRAVVVGDSDFATNSFFPFMANSDLALSMVRWLVREESEVPIASRMHVPPLILLTKAQMQALFLIVEILLPLAVMVVGGLIWWRRR